MPPRLTIVESHPIQYKAPLFRLLASDPDIDLKILYAMIPDTTQQGTGFGLSFAWDVPLLEGYPYEVLRNRARNPAVNRFNGCDTPEIYAVLKRKRPDAVLVNGWVVKTCLQTLWACRRLGIPCLVRGEANLLRPRAWWKHVLHRLLLKQYQGYLAIGSANRDFYRFHHCPQDRLFFAPYAVDNDRFAADAAAREGRRDKLRQSFGIPPDAMVLLFCGKLESKKHPMDALKALQKLSAFQSCGVSPPQADVRHGRICLRRTPVAQAFLLIVGDGPLRSECEQYAKTHRLPVAFTGFLNQSRLPDAYAVADVLVLPSDAGETWGLVVNEAMTSGRPAIVSKAVGCCPDLIVNGQTGFAFDCGDINGLAEIMSGYLREPELAARQGAAAQKHIHRYRLQETATGIVAAARKIADFGCR